IPAHAQRGVGVAPLEDLETLGEGLEQAHAAEGRLDQALAAQATEGDGVQRDAGGWHQAVFHALLRAQPAHAPATALHLIGHGQAGHDVPAGAGGHDHQMRLGCGLAHARPPLMSCRFSMSTRRQMASAMQLSSTPEPPKLIRGRVRPLVGSTPRFTPMLMKAWPPIHTATPCATRPEKTRSSAMAWRPMLNRRTTSQKKARMTAPTPMKPSSSPITASRKSVWASGR